MLGFREKKSQKKQVLLLSTKCKAENERKSKRRAASVRITDKPKMIRNYNSYMGGIDGNDQMFYQYLDDRRTLKIWKKVTFNIIARMMLNSYIIYHNNTDKPLNRLHYTVSVIEDLAKDWLALQENRPNVADLANITPNRISKVGAGGDTGIIFGLIEKIPDGREKNCCICSKLSTQAGGKRKKSSFMCVKCKKGLHGKCVPKHDC